MYNKKQNEKPHILTSPEMPLDNTDTERSIRDMVMGKKAYLYCRNYEAVDRACIMYSLDA